MKKTKIEWCDATINPVVGCPRGCKYCYAKRLNDRFKWIDDFSKPQFFPERLKEFESKKPKSIFVNSMSDYEFWSDEQLELIGEAIYRNPQHKYIFLTKGTLAFDDFDQVIFNGKTITTQADADKKDYYGFDFLSIEPLLEPIKIPIWKGLKQIIIGAETGNRKGKVIPKKEWIDDIVKQADEYGIRVFMKNSLKSIMGKDFRQDRLVWEVSK